MNKKKIIILLSSVVVLLGIIAFITYHYVHQSQDDWKNQRKQEVINNRDERNEIEEIRKHLQVNIQRYEKAIFSADTNNMEAEVKRLGKQYPVFIAPDAWKNPQLIEQLKAFLHDPYIREIYNDVMKRYGNLTPLTEELKTALSYYKFYFPDAVMPDFYTVVGGIDPSAPFIDSYENMVIINLDWYLGKDYKYYQDYRIPQFIRAQCERKNIALDCFRRSIAYRQIPQKTPITLLDYMILEGKRIYLTELVFPETPVSDIIGYTPQQFAWAEKYQADVWNYLIENNLLFSKDSDPIRRLIDEAPFSNPFGKQSPGRIGAYVGWMILINYMEKNPEIDLKQMMQETNSRTILDKSGYKPLKQ